MWDDIVETVAGVTLLAVGLVVLWVMGSCF